MNFEGAVNLTADAIVALLSHESQSQLTSLNISRSQSWTSKSIALIAQKCPKLESLRLTSLRFVSDRDIQALVQGCRHFRTLGVSRTSISDHSIHLLLEAYPSIEVLEVENCPRVSLEGQFAVMRIVIKQHLMSSDPDRQLIGTQSIRRVLSDGHNLRIDGVISLGVVPTLVRFLTRDEFPSLQYEATWALTNIASGTSDHTEAVVGSGAVPLFVRLLSSPNVDVVEQAAWALGNIAGDSIIYRDMVLSAGALPILSSIPPKRISVTRNITWTISNLCHGKPPPPIEDLTNAFPFLLTQLTGTDSQSQCDACSAISHISDGENSRIQAIIDANLLPPIAHLLANAETQDLISAALHVIGNVLTGDESQTQSVLNLNVLPTLCNLLNPKSRMKKETCWSISNITAGNVTQIQAVIDAQIIPKLMALGCSSTSDICRECLWCLANAIEQKNFKQLQYFIGEGLIPFLAWHLNNSSKPQLLYVALSAIHNIIQTNGNGNGEGEGEGDTAEGFHELVAVATGARLKQLKKEMGRHPDISAILDSIFEKLQYPLPEDDLPTTDDLAAPAAATEEEEEMLEEQDDQFEELDVVMDLISGSESNDSS